MSQTPEGEPWQWCIDRFSELDHAASRRLAIEDERFAVIERKLDDLAISLTGNQFHPNGLVADVRKLKTAVRQLEDDWRQFLDRARGFAIGIAIGSGVAGGGAAALLLKFFGGGV